MKKRGTDRTQKASKDTFTGRVAEETLMYLLDSYFRFNKLDVHIYDASKHRKDVNIFKIVKKNYGDEKQFDIDIVVKNVRKEDKKYFLISCKGSAREGIGQYLSNLFLMDDRLIKAKYRDSYYLEFARKGVKIKYAFVCYDWGKTKDFLKYTKTGKERETLKSTEILLINDENYISGGIAVLNNHENLDGVVNFGTLAARIAQFLN
ncbi:MAG: hypothetical protein GDA54_03240 [Alphaproteobacteria bacterium GM7ARS4]|nr:hypothetical protein [Alphaproteobacteria bacterium GM7ARS4]